MTTNNHNDSVIRKFLSDEQDPEAVQKAVDKVSQILTADEEIMYVAVQKEIGFAPDCAVLTNRRLIVYSPTLLGGANFKDHIWRDLKDAHLSEGMIRATFTARTVTGQVITLDKLPKSQGRKLYSIAQQMEEKVREERRNRQMEEKRAASGGVYLQGNSSFPPAAPAASAASSQENPVQKLKQLKEMMEMGLITAEEYEAKKNDILSKM